MVLRKVIKEKHSPCSAVQEREVVILRCALRAASTFLWSKLALLKMTSSRSAGRLQPHEIQLLHVFQGVHILSFNFLTLEDTLQNSSLQWGGGPSLRARAN